MIIIVEPAVMQTRFTAFGAAGTVTETWQHTGAASGTAEAEQLTVILRRLTGNEPVEAVAFHLYFGGEFFDKPVRVTAGFISTMKKMAAFSPLYLPAVCGSMELFRTMLKDTPLFAFSETSLFSGLPARERRYPIAPKFFGDSGVMKRGFHGIYHGMHAARFGRHARVISVVLDRYTSVCALDRGTAASVSFGWTPLEGIMSGRSCGDVDPGIIVYLMKEHGYSMYRIDDLLKKESGFYGMTGSDLPPETLIGLYGKVPEVTLAFDVYKNQILKHIGDALTVMNGFEIMVFAGQNVLPFRPIVEGLAKQLSFMGVQVSGAPWDMAAEAFPITAATAERQAYVTTLDEAEIIRRETLQRLKHPHTAP
jgi:acetate kinase